MIQPAQLKLDVFNAEHRREFVEKLQGAVVVISDSEIKAYKGGKEMDLAIDFVYGPGLRFGNGNGVYRVGEDTTAASGQGQASEVISDTIRDIWTKRRMGTHISMITSQSLAPRDIYASRRGQVSA